MYYPDKHEPLKDTEEVTSGREGQTMQPMDEQPSGQPLYQQSTSEPSNRESPEGQFPDNIQEQRAGQAGEGQTLPEVQGNSYRGTSEQIPFSYPPSPTAYPPGGVSPQMERARHPASPPGASWTYPPQPEQYQQGQSNSAVTRPFEAITPGASITASTTPGFPYQASALVGTTARRSGLRTGALVALVALLALVFGTGLFAGWQFGRTSSPSANPAVFQPGNNSSVNVPQLTNNNADVVREAVIKKVQPGVVQIDVMSASQHSLGSGVIVDGRGYIVTNNHVVANASSIQVTLSDGTPLPAQKVGGDPADDLAIIKITPPAAGLSVVNLGDSAQLRVGQEVLAIGSPLGNAGSATAGIISALTRSISEGQGGATIPDAIQTDAPINPGNSGGALVDLQGNLVGIPTLNAIDTEFNTPANGLGFAIPANRVKYIVQQLIANGHVSHTGRAILGVGVVTVTPTIAARNHLGVNSGVLVESVTPDSSAASAGMKGNDVIVAVDGKPVHNTSDLSHLLLLHNPGDTVAVKVSRGSDQLTLHVTLGELAVS